MSHVCSWWSALQCFFGGAGCSEAPGLRGTLYIATHIISHIAGANLLRHAEGATLLAIVTVRICFKKNNDLCSSYLTTLLANLRKMSYERGFASFPQGGGGCTPLYKLYRYVSPHRVGFFRRFGLKTGIHFAYFGF